MNPTKLTSVAQEYHKKADKLVTRHTDEKGVFDSRIQPTLDYYRDAAASVMRLVTEDEAAPAEAIWNLEGDEPAALKSGKGVTTRDKAATPQELLAKA